MIRYNQKLGAQRGRERTPEPAPEQPDLSRRVMLIGSGGLMLAVAGLAGCATHPLQAGALDPSPAGAGRTSPVPARRTPTPRKTARVNSASPPPTGHPKPHPHPHPNPADTDDGPPPAQPVYYVDDGPMAIALTIDDGPSPDYTPQILKLLDKYRIQASFSMVGENVTYYPSVAREVADAGHVIVNHTWDHADLATLTAAQTRAEIADAADAIHHAVGRTPTIFRAPYGAWSRTALEYCEREGLMALDWSVDPRDWARPGVSQIVRNILRNTGTGSIILEHDGGGDRSQTVAALKIAIPRLLDRGYHFKAV